MTGLNFSNFINSILLTICLEFLQILGAVNRARARKVGCGEGGGHGLVLVGASGWLGCHHPGQDKAVEILLVREGLAHQTRLTRAQEAHCSSLAQRLPLV